MTTKADKQFFLAETLKRCLIREPRLSLQEIAVVIAEEIPVITEFLKEYKKELKNPF